MNKNQVKKNIAERLKIARELSGLSQLQASQVIGMSRPTITEIEAGRRNVSSQEILHFSKIYDVDTSWLLGNEEESNDFADSKLKLAARELSKMSKDDVDKLFKILSTIKKDR